MPEITQPAPEHLQNMQSPESSPMHKYEEQAQELASDNSDPIAYAANYLNTMSPSRPEITEETIETALFNADAMRETARAAIRMPKANFEQLITGDGVFKTAYEMGSSSGGSRSHNFDHYMVNRGNIEKRLNLTPDDGEPSVIYGYLDNLRTLGEVTPASVLYGDVAVVLKPEALDRSTFTPDDSARTQGTPLMDSDTAIVAKELNDIAHYSGEATTYIEAQIFGGVTTEDIEAVSVTMDTAREVGVGDVESFITLCNEKLPGVDVLVRVPIDDKVSKKLVDLAANYPDVTFVFFNDTKGPTPFKNMVRNQHSTVLSEGYKAESQKTSEQTYAASRERTATVTKALQSYWQETTGETELPNNVSFVTGDTVFS